MLSANALSIVVGVSGLLGLLALLAYLVFQLQVIRVERSMRQAIEGEGLFNASQIIRILEQFKDDAARLDALRELAKLDSAKAEAILRKVKDKVDITALQRLSDSHVKQVVGPASLFFLAIAAVGLLFTERDREPAVSTSPDVSVVEATWAMSMEVPKGWSPCACFVPSILPIPAQPLPPNSIFEIRNDCRATVDAALVKDTNPPPGGLPLVARASVPVGSVLKADFSGAYRIAILTRTCSQ